jgi:hypothetical protein
MRSSHGSVEWKDFHLVTFAMSRECRNDPAAVVVVQLRLIVYAIFKAFGVI